MSTLWCLQCWDQVITFERLQADLPTWNLYSPVCGLADCRLCCIERGTALCCNHMYGFAGVCTSSSMQQWVCSTKSLSLLRIYRHLKDVIRNVILCSLWWCIIECILITVLHEIWLQYTCTLRCTNHLAFWWYDYRACMFWESGALGCYNTGSLIHSLWHTLKQHFGTRGYQEHLQISLEDFRFVKKPGTNDVEYVDWTEGLTKTRRGRWKTIGASCSEYFCQEMIDVVWNCWKLQMSNCSAKFRTWCPMYSRPLKTPQPAHNDTLSSQLVRVRSMRSRNPLQKRLVLTAVGWNQCTKNAGV